jgi:hypothetical protein
MSEKHLRTSVLLACALVAAVPLSAQSKKAAKKTDSPAAAPAAPAAPPKVGVAVESILDRRTTGDFPSPSLTVNLNIDGEDAKRVASARARVTSAQDDTGQSLIQDEKKKMMTVGSDGGWQQAREDNPPSVRLELASPTRKAKTVTSLEGVLESYLPSRDPAATVRIDGILAKKDKPPLAVPALASQKIRLQVLSKDGLERAKKQAEAKKKADAEKKKKKEGKKEGLEGMAEAMAEGMAGVFGEMFDRLFMTAGENDLILKVEDPGKKLFSFDLAARDGKPIATYGTMEMENYRIVRMFEPIPEGSSLLVHLKTPKAFAETPFTLTNLKLP